MSVAIAQDFIGGHAGPIWSSMSQARLHKEWKWGPEALRYKA